MVLGRGMETPQLCTCPGHVCVGGSEGCLHRGNGIFGLCDTGKRVACGAEGSSGGDGMLSWVVCLKSIP